MYHRLSQHLSVNNTLINEQFGFRKKLSTKHAAYSVEFITHGMINLKLLEYSVIDPETLRLVAQCLNYYVTSGPIPVF
jgi:hypothetical protein